LKTTATKLLMFVSFAGRRAERGSGSAALVWLDAIGWLHILGVKRSAGTYDMIGTKALG
jgi:hypothetical protein